MGKIVRWLRQAGYLYTIGLSSSLLMGKITVEKDGLIRGIDRYTEIPFSALALAESNMINPDTAERGVFVCSTSGDKHK